MIKKEIKEKINKIAETSHINFLFGVGTSAPFIPIIPEIEKKLNIAQESNNMKEVIRLKREFFSSVMAPCLNIKSYFHSRNFKGKKVKKNDITKTHEAYELFFAETIKYLLSRTSTLLDKQVNLFTTNIDIFAEKVLEDSGIYYNDGFMGRMAPSFRTSNFSTIVKKKSEYFEKQSEIPTINLYKLHGSLTWKLGDKEEKIVYSDLSILEKLQRSKDDDEFDKLYSMLRIVNPTSKKFEASVLQSTYYELFRLYATALEKENTLLIVIGFSFNDKHVLDVTSRAIDSNPTLTVYIFSHSREKASIYEKKFEGVRYRNNVKIISPTQKNEKFDLEWVAKNFISELDTNARY